MSLRCPMLLEAPVPNQPDRQETSMPRLQAGVPLSACQRHGYPCAFEAGFLATAEESKPELTP